MSSKAKNENKVVGGIYVVTVSLHENRIFEYVFHWENFNVDCIRLNTHQNIKTERNSQKPDTRTTAKKCLGADSIAD